MQVNGAMEEKFGGKNNMSEDVFINMLEDDEESPYCKTCDSCGETGCCPPINCQAVKCKYGEINLKDYKCFQNQWDIMFNALRDIASNYNLDDGNILRQHLAQLAQNALNAVDKEWDKIYSKENND